MEVIDIVVAYTSDTTIKTVVPALVGKPLPYAFFVNYNCHGYAKFKIEKRDLLAFDEKLS